jgi:hypothetical protein
VLKFDKNLDIQHTSTPTFTVTDWLSSKSQSSSETLVAQEVTGTSIMTIRMELFQKMHFIYKTLTSVKATCPQLIQNISIKSKLEKIY